MAPNSFMHDDTCPICTCGADKELRAELERAVREIEHCRLMHVRAREAMDDLIAENERLTNLVESQHALRGAAEQHRTDALAEIERLRAALADKEALARDVFVAEYDDDWEVCRRDDDGTADVCRDRAGQYLAAIRRRAGIKPEGER